MIKLPTVLITGASGFVGRGLINYLVNQKFGFKVLAIVRYVTSYFPDSVIVKPLGHISGKTDWTSALMGVDIIVHCMARVHHLKDNCSDVISEYREANVQSTINFARQAAMAGVKRFIFISSVKVNGPNTEWRPPFTADDIPAPIDPYAVSKFEAELELRQISSQFNMDLVIIRPPLIYGPAVKANFASLLRLVASGLPLPLGAIQNSKSMVALENLLDLIATCIVHPRAPGHTFMVSDDEDISTPDLLYRLSRFMRKNLILFPVPVSILKFGGQLIGKQDVVERLTDSLQVNIEKTKFLLNWSPRLTVNQGLKKTIEESNI